MKYIPYRLIAALCTVSLCASAQVGQANPKVIYGPDDRLDVYQVSDPTLLSYADSTCAVVRQSDLTNNGNGTYTAKTSYYSVCPDEPFVGQRTLANCTAFLIADDMVATAGHCLNAGNYTLWRFVFGFYMVDANTETTLFDSSQVYRGVQLVGHALANGDDWAVVKLDRKVTAPGAIPLEIRRSGFISVGEHVGVIGHPAGLPTKVAFGATTVVKYSASNLFFEANLDTYGGNSGSPVFNQTTGIVEGILVRGQTDFSTQYNNGLPCYVSIELPDSTGQGGQFEECSRTTRISSLVPLPGHYKGDVNNDFFINATDLQSVINVVLGITTDPDADINDDQRFDAIDVQAMILLLIG